MDLLSKYIYSIITKDHNTLNTDGLFETIMRNSCNYIDKECKFEEEDINNILKESNNEINNINKLMCGLLLLSNIYTGNKIYETNLQKNIINNKLLEFLDNELKFKCLFALNNYDSIIFKKEFYHLTNKIFKDDYESFYNKIKNILKDSDIKNMNNITRNLFSISRNIDIIEDNNAYIFFKYLILLNCSCNDNSLYNFISELHNIFIHMKFNIYIYDVITDVILNNSLNINEKIKILQKINKQMDNTEKTDTIYVLPNTNTYKPKSLGVHFKNMLKCIFDFKRFISLLSFMASIQFVFTYVFDPKYVFCLNMCIFIAYFIIHLGYVFILIIYKTTLKHPLYSYYLYYYRKCVLHIINNKSKISKKEICGYYARNSIFISKFGLKQIEKNKKLYCTVPNYDV